MLKNYYTFLFSEDFSVWELMMQKSRFRGYDEDRIFGLRLMGFLFSVASCFKWAQRNFLV